MEIIKVNQKRGHGNEVFHIEILYPGMALGLQDTGFYTIGRIDHASFRPPGLVPMHPHRDDEILSYMRSGQQIHKDTAGNQEHINSTYMMLMNAGSGVSHEEIAEGEVEMLQIFMRPYKNGLQPMVQFHQFEETYSIDHWRLVAGNAGDAPLKLRVGTNIFDVRLSTGTRISLPVAGTEAHHLLYCFNGTVTAEGRQLHKGDSLIFNNEHVAITAEAESDLILFQIDAQTGYSVTGMFSGNQFL